MLRCASRKVSSFTKYMDNVLISKSSASILFDVDATKIFARSSHKTNLTVQMKNLYRLHYLEIITRCPLHFPARLLVLLHHIHFVYVKRVHFRKAASLIYTLPADWKLIIRRFFPSTHTTYPKKLSSMNKENQYILHLYTCSQHFLLSCMAENIWFPRIW